MVPRGSCRQRLVRGVFYLVKRSGRGFCLLDALPFSARDLAPPSAVPVAFSGKPCQSAAPDSPLFFLEICISHTAYTAHQECLIKQKLQQLESCLSTHASSYS